MIKTLTTLLVTVLTAVACQSAGNTSARADIIIASDLPTSAFDSALPFEHAIDFAIRSRSTIEGYSVAYWPLDNSLGAQQSQLRGRGNVRRMIADPSVLGMVGPFSSFVGRIEIPEANRAHLAMISMTTTSSCLTLAIRVCQPTAAELRPTGTNNFFRLPAPDPAQGKAMAAYAATKLGLRRVAAFNEFGPEGAEYIKQFSDEFASKGGTVVYQQELDDSTSDFSAFFTQAKLRRADAVYAVANVSGNACKAAAQMTKSMPGAVFLGTDGISLDNECLRDIGPTPPAIWATSPTVDAIANPDPAVKDLVNAYLKAYPAASTADLFPNVTAYTFAAFDCARILIDAIGRAIKANGGKLPSRMQVVTALAQTKDFVGVTGTYSFDQNGDAVKPMMSIYTVRDGRWRNVPL